jgi:HAD superfamily hydrolase (TIGR01509 family)
MAIRAIGFDYLDVIAHPDGGRPGLDDQILHLAGQLRAAGYRVGLLSNLGADWGPELARLGLDEYFEAIMLSGETGYIKPDPRAFELLAERLGVSTHELIFIDDSAQSLSGVEEIGVTPILYRDYDQLVVALIQNGISWD